MKAEYIDRGVALVLEGVRTNWGWGDLALDVAGPVGEGGDRGVDKRLRQLREDVVARGGFHGDDVLSVETLRSYRYIANAIPPAAREGVTISAGRELASIEDKAERLGLIQKLLAEDGRVEINAVRAYLNKKPRSGTAKAREQEIQAALAAETIRTVLHSTTVGIRDARRVLRKLRPDIAGELATDARMVEGLVQNLVQALVTIALDEGIDDDELAAWIDGGSKED